ncbi:MAG: hypothetical protein DSZ03_00640, partial [Sulfurimonas sp.]
MGSYGVIVKMQLYSGVIFLRSKMVNMTNEFDTLLASRALTLKFVENFTPKQLNRIPEGFKNNLI